MIRGKSCTKPNYSLRSLIPVRTFYSPEERNTPGYFQIDTVHHCGTYTGGEYCLTLTVTDIFSGWTDLHSLLNKAHKWTFEGLQKTYNTLPFTLIELHPDNGVEFINECIIQWASKVGISYTHSRSRHKNDNCFVEQKNNSLVRNYIGYYRLMGENHQQLLANVYSSLVPLLNYFIPVKKLVSKEKIGSKEVKKYDTAKSPFERLIESDKVTEETKNYLMSQHQLYNPVILQQNVNDAIKVLQNAVLSELAVKTLS